ncbi:FAD-dependent oxidoreductase [Subtercola endophyticus]|uniref:FAD-dependent oxidoreductase n=1 Tax=Subtercola endophyticus TaxID=2895559 RepID=UPI001E453DD4|nr:FAD-dependent oxidoreductase [Subtercola endophyticus]UFS57858.1 FAD-dependent oxidoreductase [Subtercola endophyticus]
MIRSIGATTLTGAMITLVAGCAPNSTPGAKRVLVYGGTPSGIAAAVAVAREGIDVQLVLGESPLGGMMTNGLGRSDIANPALVGGLADVFFRLVGKIYGQVGPVYNFEPHVALQAFQSMLDQYAIKPIAGVVDHVVKNGLALTGVVLLDGTTLTADVFVDSSYEGLLLQQSGVQMTYGREATSAFGEKRAGYGYHFTQFPVPAGKEAGVESEGLSATPTQKIGAADSKIMAFNYRLCLTDDLSNAVPFSKAPNYDASQFEVLARSFSNGVPYSVRALQVAPHKFDLNGGGFFDTDLVGGSWGFPVADLAGRKSIADVHRAYTMNLLYFLSNDPSIPKQVREQTRKYGLAKDEFGSSNNFPSQLYIRENLRMIGDVVLVESDLLGNNRKPDAIAIGAYAIDCHYVQRFVDRNGNVVMEGTMPSTETVTGYQIPYGALLPKNTEASNIISSVCISASHVAWASLRVEPTFLVLGEAAGVAAALSAKSGDQLHQLNAVTVQSMLTAKGALISV